MDDKKVLKKSLSDLIEAVAEFNGITISELTGRSRVHRLTDARKIFMLIAQDYTTITQREVAERLALSATAVSKQTNSALSDAAIREKVKACVDKWIGGA